jgi:hypothetical protein
MSQNRIELSDTLLSAMMKMCKEENGNGSNPGCADFLIELTQKKDWKAGGENMGFMYMLYLDSIGLYGSKAYMLWNDCCRRNLEEVELVLRNYQMGYLSKEKIQENLSQGYGTSFANLIPLDKLFSAQEVRKLVD